MCSILCYAGKDVTQRNDGRISVKDKDERTGCPAGR